MRSNVYLSSLLKSQATNAVSASSYSPWIFVACLRAFFFVFVFILLRRCLPCAIFCVISSGKCICYFSDSSRLLCCCTVLLYYCTTTTRYCCSFTTQAWAPTVRGESVVALKFASDYYSPFSLNFILCKIIKRVVKAEREKEKISVGVKRGIALVMWPLPP